MVKNISLLRLVHPLFIILGVVSVCPFTYTICPFSITIYPFIVYLSIDSSLPHYCAPSPPTTNDTDEVLYHMTTHDHHMTYFIGLCFN